MKTRLDKAIIVIGKVCEIVFLVLALLALIGGLSVLLGSDKLAAALEASDGFDGILESAGFSVRLVRDGRIIPGFLAFFCFSVILPNLCLCMIFRNIYLIFRTTAGKTSFSKGETPFQKENIRMIREIGIFSIFLTVLGFMASLIGKLAFGPELLETSVSLTGLVFGIVVIALSRYFSYGLELQEETDGLV